MRSSFPGVSWTVEHWHELWRFGLRPGSMPAMTFALICVTLATAVRIELGRLSPDSAAFAPYYSATLVVALVGGAGAASVAAVLGGAISYFFFILPEGSFAQHAVTQLVSLGSMAPHHSSSSGLQKVIEHCWPAFGRRSGRDSFWRMNLLTG